MFRLLVLCLCLPGCATTSVTSYVSGCGPGTFVFVKVDYTGIFADPVLAMKQEASRLCPMGYDQRSENSLPGVNTTTWRIRCHTATGQPAETAADSPC